MPALGTANNALPPPPPPPQGFSSLRKLDFSYNEIRSAEPLSTVTGSASTLHELFLASNKVTAIRSLAPLTCLESLELGSNRIRQIEGLETLTNLRDLWLGRNRIASIGGLGT